jgi:D-alanyl-D-alanine carboxypeptidase/D-alanyl-D-alanine-endopeptidase (penicillin-binding protein 4)
MFRRILHTFALILILTIAVPLAVEAEEAAKKESLTDKIEAILELEKASGGTWAIEVVSLDTGEVLCKMNSRRAMVPASNMKLFTTAAALHYLGPDFVTKTSFYFDGKPSAGGILDGDLIVRGRGDPNISGRFHDSPTSIFEEIAAKLKTMGLRHVKGDVIGDDSYFDNQYYGPWLPKEKHKWYAARVSALSFNDNCIDICVTPGAKPGAKAKVVKSPHTSFARVVNKASTTNRKKNSVWASPLGNGRDILVGGKIWSGKKMEELWFPVDSPPLYTATVFKETLERKGIKISGKPRALGKNHKTAVPGKAVPVIEYESLPLSEMIKVINKRSQNLHAELMLKHIGLQHAGKPTFEDGTKAIIDFIKTTGIKPGSVVVKDGSGLCRENRASAHSISQLLRYMDSSEHAETFRDSLAVSGIDRSLKGMTWIAPKGKIMAKTGWLKGTLAFSGYVDGKTQRLAFSIIVNDYTADSMRVRRARDRISAELASY